ncbi:MAG: hypothetical protein WBP89_09840, partial [Sedimenticolaceae bacterium]
MSAPPAYAEPDDAQQAWLDLVRIGASWENVTTGEAWFDGPRPTRSTGAAWHSITLQTSRDATVRLPMGERLRLQHPDGPVRAGDLEFSWSNGSGLFASLAPRTSDDGRSLEVAPP